MNDQWIQEYLNEHSEQDFLDYLQNNQKQSNILLQIDYDELNLIIEEAKSLHQIKEGSQYKLELSLEKEILLTFIFLTQDVELYSLILLFGFSSKSLGILEDICWYWKLIFQENNLLWHKVKLVKKEVVREVNISKEKRALHFTKSIIQSNNDASFFCYSQRVKRQDLNTPKILIENYCIGDSVASIGNSVGSVYNVGSVGSVGAQIHINKRTEPLPHDGLFIRRNNQFGTRIFVGIKDLIEQGVIIEQTNIRFDDFVALNSERVPSPQADNSLAISYGIAPISLSQKRDERATHYLEIALKTSATAPREIPTNQAPSVNYIFVVDTSGSMSGEKLDSVKSSIQELFKHLREDDVMGIIEFNNQPKTLLKATPVKQIKIDHLSQLLSSMISSGGTDLNIALSFGVDEISRHGRSHTLNHIYLFTDGNPTSGETNWIKIRQNVDAKTRGNIRLSTFAFGSDANLRELDALAGLTGGKSTFITCPEDIQINLQDELSRREHLAAINVQIKVDIEQDVDILYLYGHDLIIDPVTRSAVLQNVERAKKKAEEEFDVTPEADLVTEEKGIRIFVPDLAVGETYWIVFELNIPEDKQKTSIGKTTVQYLDTFTRQNQKPEWELSFPGNLPPDLVVEHGLALWTSEVAFYTIDDLYEQDINTAKKRIENHVALLCSVNDVLNSPYLSDDAITLRKFLSLSQNLGKLRSFSDISPQGAKAYYIYSLNEFGRVRSGFNRAKWDMKSC